MYPKSSPPPNPDLSREQIAQQRLAICRACDYVYPATMQCHVCGCFLHAKARLLNQHCPLGTTPETAGQMSKW